MGPNDNPRRTAREAADDPMTLVLIEMGKISVALDRVEKDVQTLQCAASKRPSVVAWIGAVASLLAVAFGPAGIVYWRFTDAITELQRNDARQEERLKTLIDDMRPARPAALTEKL